MIKKIAAQESSEQNITNNNKVFRFVYIVLILVFAIAVSSGLYLLKAMNLPEPVFAKQPEQAKDSDSKHVIEKSYVGAQACKECHLSEFNAWQGSHHQLAMQHAEQQSVLGDFNDVTFEYNGIKSFFYQRDGQFFVRTDGPEGKLAHYPIKYTFGVSPLQQYLIEFPGGRLQALSIAWDSRAQSEGGQRWFHLYPNENIKYTDQLHWTGRYQNWNLQCAECHSTHLKKNYNAESDSYQTTFTELNVACEACHGPASQHIEWGKKTQQSDKQNEENGLVVQLNSRWGEAWKFSGPEAKFAERDKRANDELMNVCWSCHSRRSTLVEGTYPGLPLEMTHRPALLAQPTYYADGQQRDEDYTWGSFKQSKMFQKGVTCMDCHEPHSLSLRAEGNGLCGRCHNPKEFDTERHHYHKPDSEGGKCIDCHAPEQNYMIIDGRHDHSFRLPRPDLSLRIGSPNACIQCHENREDNWAVNAMDRWYGSSWKDRPHYGIVLDAALTQGLKALPSLLELAQDQHHPAIVRATAVTLMSPFMQPGLMEIVKKQLQDDDQLIRMAALGLTENLDVVNRLKLASPLLSDSIYSVRIEAARILADIAENQIPAKKLTSYRSALKDYIQSQQVNQDWPSANVNLGNLYSRQGKFEAATKAYRQALSLDPGFTAAYIGLSELFRIQKKDDEGEKVLRDGLEKVNNSADLHHSLGLLLIRKADREKALAELAAANEIAPNNVRYGYVYGVALHSMGKVQEAVDVFKAIDEQHPYDLSILNALISIHRESGDYKSALFYARKAIEVMPEEMEIKRLIYELENAKIN
ncbi:MAG: tetratricopeptide repeat protein [Gammaproteobacteria bacterium]